MKGPGGIADAIGVLRSLGLAERLAEVGVDDGGDLVLEAPDGVRGDSGLLNERGLGTLARVTREQVGQALAADRFPLLVGGDCPVVLGALAAVRDAGERVGLLMLDGHEDAWPPDRSPTGEASDSEVAIALGTVRSLPEPLDRLVPLTEESSVALIGPRDADEITRAGVPTLRDQVAVFASAQEVRPGPLVAQQMASALDALSAEAFWLHIDLDVLCSAAFPAVDYPQPGGLDWPQLDGLAAAAARDRRCRGISVVIYNPDLDPDRDSARDLIDFSCRLVGTASGRA
jgi:arginase